MEGSPCVARLPVAATLVAAAALSLVAVAPTATAHQTFTVSHYTVEYSWQSEPAVVDSPNAVRIAVSDSSADDAPVTDNVDLTVTITYGGKDKALDLETTDDTPGEWFGALVPTKEGTYAIHISGSINGSSVDKTANLEEVTGVKEQGFPGTQTATGSAAMMALWIGGGAGVLALALFAAATALSMALVSTAFGHALVRGTLARRLQDLIPAMGSAGLAFGVWYALGALAAVPYPF